MNVGDLCLVVRDFAHRSSLLCKRLRFGRHRFHADQLAALGRNEDLARPRVRSCRLTRRGIPHWHARHAVFASRIRVWLSSISAGSCLRQSPVVEIKT